VNALRAVYLHELKRSMTAGRVIWWFAMAAFPVLITLIIWMIDDFGRGATPSQLDTFWSLLLYTLIPCVCCSLSVLLMAAPAVATELEQRSWVYLATRPNGIFWLLLGKYLVSVTWGSTAAWAGILGAIPFVTSTTPIRLGATLAGLSLLSSVSYSAVYLLIGALFPKRAMVFSVMYTGLVEVVLGFIPAVVNRMTVQYRMRSLLVQWMPTDEEMREAPAFAYVFGEGSSSVQILWLITLTAIFLSAALVVAHRKEFTTASEGDL
jgi:hypothetical protein